MLAALLLSACGGYKSAPGAGEQSAEVPTASGGTYDRDGFYDGGIFDPDQMPPTISVPE